ncbi:ALP1-like protein [Tanacetum coccineum]
MGGSSSQLRTEPTISPINAFSVEELYTPEFLNSFQENTGYWQQPDPHESSVKQVATSPTKKKKKKKKKKATRNRQKRTIESDDAPRQTTWTTEEEIALAKGWLAVSENSKHGNERRKAGFWCEESGVGDEDYVQREMIHYEIETGLPFKLRHCWEILKDRPKWQEISIPNFNIGSEGGSKRHKSSGSSSSNTKSGEASINLNTNVGDNDEDEVQEIRRPEGRDKARASRKNKGSKTSRSSTINADALARLMVTEMTAQEKE